jgi:dsRNA-specific ribonuclease
METTNYEKELNEKLTKLELLMVREIPKEHFELFSRVIITDSSSEYFNNHKLNEVDHLHELDGLETYGDAVLDLFVCEKLFKQGTRKKYMTIERSKIVSNKILQNKGLFLLQGMLIEVNPSSEDKKRYAKALERLIGAIYEAFGTDYTREFLTVYNII